MTRRTEDVAARDAADEALSIVMTDVAYDELHADEDRAVDGDGWHGTDYFLPDGRVLRTVAVDGSYAYGIDLYLFADSRSWLVLRSADLKGFSPEGTALAMRALAA